jgi:hypothetical protein
VTTLPAPTTVSLPMLTPGQTMTPLPSQAPSPIEIGCALSQRSRRCSGSSGWAAVSSWTPVAICTSSPIVTGAQSRNTAP